MAEQSAPERDATVPTSQTQPTSAKPDTAAARPEAVAPKSAKADGTAVAREPKQEKNEPPPPDPMLDLLRRMGELQRYVVVDDRELASRVQRLVQLGADADRRAQPAFRHDIAYALQDIEKTSLGPLSVDPKLRAEMTERAASAPGLENPRLLALMASTGSLHDKHLVHDIRQAGRDLGRQREQLSPTVQGQIDTLENRYRLSQRAPDPEPAATAESLRPNRGAEPELATRPGGPQQTAQGAPTPPQTVSTKSNNPLNMVLSAFRPPAQGTGAPWDPPPTPMAERLSLFEKKMTEAADERIFERTLKSGRAALDAMQRFGNGEGAAIMNRILEAARRDPDGMAGVLSEMRDGGRFADLRKQFNTALASEHGLAAAYGRAADALQQYGKDRSIVQDIIGRRADASAVTARFEKLDAEIGEAAAKTPSRNDGHSMLEDLTQKAAELLHKAIDAVRSAFSRGAGAEAGARSSPSPSIG